MVLGRGDDLAVGDQVDDGVVVDEDVLDGLGKLLPGLGVGRDDLVPDTDVFDRLAAAVGHEHGRGFSERAGTGSSFCGSQATTCPDCADTSLPPCATWHEGDGG